MSAYYNEIDPYAAQWLRNLIVFGYIADGEVDERSIADVRPEELRGFTQCHFFAGIGVWSHALRRAGWPDDRPVWTGSCPCQPFSAAGKRGGTADERHLWPHWFHLIATAKPRGVPVFGEQVASKDGLAWLDLVHADLEGQGYTVGALDLCAAGVGAPHIRQRLFFVADTGRDGAQSGRPDGERKTGGDEGEAQQRQRVRTEHSAGGAVGVVADTAHVREYRSGNGRQGRAGIRREVAVQPAGGSGASVERREADVQRSDGATRGFWHPADWLPCIDGKARPVEPGTFPLAHGAPARVGRLRAYGNAINAETAAAFIEAYLGR
jgi:DNA (cytosine-5)-methyltransferase 1